MSKKHKSPRIKCLIQLELLICILYFLLHKVLQCPLTMCKAFKSTEKQWAFFILDSKRRDHDGGLRKICKRDCYCCGFFCYVASRKSCRQKARTFCRHLQWKLSFLLFTVYMIRDKSCFLHGSLEILRFSFKSNHCSLSRTFFQAFSFSSHYIFLCFPNVKKSKQNKQSTYFH